MELKIINPENKETGKQKMPEQFTEEIRPDLIKRAVEAVQANKRQSYGADPLAGRKQAARLRRRRRVYKSGYGKGMPRTPRKTMTRRGMQMIWVAAFAPGTVGGRKAFAPVARDLGQKINDKERKKAIRSALTATLEKETVAQRGHKIPTNYPFIISNDFEKINKTAKLLETLQKIGLTEELERSGIRKIRAGYGKNRGRPYKESKGPLIIVSEECPLLNSAKNAPGIDVIEIKKVNAELLAPGTHPGRLTLFTQSSIEKIAKEKLFE